MKLCLNVFCIAVLFVGLAHANRTVWYVHPDSALNTIQAGLDSCADNDIVLVGPGTYYENIFWPNTQGIHLISELGFETTIIDGDSMGTVVKCSTIVAVNNTVIRGFTIQNGIAPETFPWGASGGIYVFNGEVTVEGNYIIYNESTGNKGAVSGAFVLCNNVISNNTKSGASGCINIDNNIITYNTIAGIRGGYNITNNYIANNTIGIFNPYRTYRNVVTHNTSYGISGGPEVFYSRGDTITYNGTGIIGGGYIDSCVIACNYGDGVRYNGVDIKFCNIYGNGRYGVYNDQGAPPFLLAEYNWWGDATGPFHPDSNPGGQGDTVSDYVDFIPWLDQPVGVWEQPIIAPITTPTSLCATIFRGPLQLPKDKYCKVFDITGREVKPHLLAPGIYFIEVDGKISQKVVKIR